MSVSGLCGCSFTTIIAGMAIRRNRDIGGLDSSLSSTIDSQVFCLAWFFSNCACDNLYSRSGKLGASSSSLSTVSCCTSACVPSCQASSSNGMPMLSKSTRASL